MEKDLIGQLRWIGGALLAVQLTACGGKAVGCLSDAVDCSDDSGDSSSGGDPAQTASTGVGGSTGLGVAGQAGGTGLGSNGQGGSAQSGSARPGTTATAPSTSTSNGSGGTFGAGTTGEGNATPTGFAGAAGSNGGASSGTSSGSTTGAAGVSGSGGPPSPPALQTAPPCPAVQSASVQPRPSCVTASPVLSNAPSCTETWCNRPTVPSVVSCAPVSATLGDAYHYTVNGDSYDATFSFDMDRTRSGQYPDQSTFLNVRFALDVGLTNQGTRIVDRIEVPAALALARGLSIVDHTIFGTLALRPGDLDQTEFERPIYESGCSPVIDRSGLLTPGPCACGFAEVSLTIPVYAPLSRIP